LLLSFLDRLSIEELVIHRVLGVTELDGLNEEEGQGDGD